MANTLQVKRHSTYNESKNPTSNQLAEGEFGWNNHGSRLWIGKKTSGSNVDAYEINPTASTSAKGLASFSNSNFSVTAAGHVSISGLATSALTGTITNAQLAGSISNDKLAGSIANSKLANSSITIGGTATALGGTITALTALTDLDLTSGNKTIFDGVGSNTLTIGASGTVVKIAGDLTVEGATTTINTATLTVEDDVIEISSGNDSRANADGSGIKIPCSGTDADITLGWQASTSAWYSPENIKSNNQIIASGGNSSQWNTAYSDRLKWDGNSTGLNAATARTSLGLVIGTNVQAYDAGLTAIAGLSDADGKFIVGSASGWVAEDGATARASLGVDAAGTDNSTDVTLGGSYDYITISGQTITRGQINLTTDVTGSLPDANIASASTWNAKQDELTFGIASGNSLRVDATDGAPNDNEYARFTASGLEGRTASELKSDLSLGSLADASTISNSNWSGTDLAVANGGTGASTAEGARTNLGVTTAFVQNAHVTQTAIDVNTSGKTIIDRITVNTLGHTTAVTSRTTTFIEDGDTIDGGTVTWTN